MKTKKARKMKEIKLSYSGPDGKISLRGVIDFRTVCRFWQVMLEEKEYRVAIRAEAQNSNKKSEGK